MAKTLIQTIESNIGRCGYIYEYYCDIPTPDTLLPIRSASTSDSIIFVVGWQLLETTANNFTFVSGTGVTKPGYTHELAANQGMPGQTGNWFYFATLPGEQLAIRSSAIISASYGCNLVLRVCEGKRFDVL